MTKEQKEKLAVLEAFKASINGSIVSAQFFAGFSEPAWNLHNGSELLTYISV